MRYPPSLNSRDRRFDNNLTHPAIAAGRKACASPPAARAGFALLLRIVKEQPIKLWFEKPEARGARCAACLWILVQPHPGEDGRCKRWWSWTGSNRRPPACKAGALPTELQAPETGIRQPATRLGWTFSPRTPGRRQSAAIRLQRQPISVSTETPRVFRERR